VNERKMNPSWNDKRRGTPAKKAKNGSSGCKACQGRIDLPGLLTSKLEADRKSDRTWGRKDMGGESQNIEKKKGEANGKVFVGQGEKERHG